MINHPVLVLNQSYEPLTVCRARRALVLVFQGKAEMLENGVGFVRSISATVPLPSVIRLASLVRRPNLKRRLTRSEIFNRDRYICQYCGQKIRHPTIDHVLPRYRGGQHTWENVVCACAACNRRKAGRTPQEAGMKLASEPRPPRGGPSFIIPYRYLQFRDEWQRYLSPFLLGQ